MLAFVFLSVCMDSVLALVFFGVCMDSCACTCAVCTCVVGENPAL